MAAEGGGNIIRFTYTGAEGEVIPDEATHIIVEARKVRTRAFEAHPNIVEVICHEDVKKIEEAAFTSCYNLRKVIMRGVKFVEEDAFCDCYGLKHVECDNLEIIKEYAFSWCKSLRNINLPSTRIVEERSFTDCTALVDVEFSDKLERIEECAFDYCRSLERIVIPLKDGLITADSIFRECDNFHQVDVIKGEVHETIAALEEWKDDMDNEIDSINQILPNASAGYYTEGEKAKAIRKWIKSVLRKIIRYQAQHRYLLDEDVATTLELVLPRDIVMNNALPFLELPPYTFEVESYDEDLSSCCKSDLLSEEGLREVIERHGLTPNNHHVDEHDFFHAACRNERVTEGIIRCLLEYFPDAVSAADEHGVLPLHCACFNKNVTLNIIQLLIDADPDSVRSVNDGWTPLHVACFNKYVTKGINQLPINEDPDSVRSEVHILNLLIEKYPEAVRCADDNGCLPIHLAARAKSPDFCQVLIEAYPGSERITDGIGLLPLHLACSTGSLATVEYLYGIFPDASDHRTTPGGYHPIHLAIRTERRENPAGAAAIVRFLLDCDPTQKLIQYQGWLSLLRFACRQPYNDSNIEAGIQIVKIIYDTHPEAIEENEITTDIQHYHQRIQTFIYGELVYARHAKDHRLMTTPDDSNGRVPLHKALQNVRLGSIKLLVKGNPHALQFPDNSGAMPLHIACQYHDSASVIQYLVGLDRGTLEAVDRQGNTALHCACRGAKYDTIALLLEEYDAASVSKRNNDEKIPIELLWENTAFEDRESLKYTESIFRILRAYPEMVAVSD